MSNFKDANNSKMDAQGQLSLLQAKRKMMLTNIEAGKEQLTHLKNTRDNAYGGAHHDFSYSGINIKNGIVKPPMVR